MCVKMFSLSIGKIRNGIVKSVMSLEVMSLDYNGLSKYIDENNQV